MMSLDRCHNIQDLQRRARATLPHPIYDYLEGGADDEWSLKRNTSAFDNWQFLPNTLMNVASVNPATRLLGHKLAGPILLSPTGMSRLFHHDKEFAAARAAERFGTFYGLSAMGSTRIEELADSSHGLKFFQVYIFKDRGLTREFLAKSKQGGYQALCLTVDTPIAGNRERDIYSGMTIPPRPTLRALAGFATKWRWLAGLAKNRDFFIANVADRLNATERGTSSIIDFVNKQFDPSISWQDLEWLASEWDGPLILKGVLSPDDARRAQRIGVSAIMVSNHGGRQLECAAAPIDCIPALRDAVGNDLELILDGGIRRGTHVVKALAMGADACSIGRPYLYGLAAGGEAGVLKALEILQAETIRTMALLGATAIDEINQSHLVPVGRLVAQPPS